MVSFIAGGGSKLAAKRLIGVEDDRMSTAAGIIDLTLGSRLRVAPAFDGTSLSAYC